MASANAKVNVHIVMNDVFHVEIAQGDKSSLQSYPFGVPLPRIGEFITAELVGMTLQGRVQDVRYSWNEREKSIADSGLKPPRVRIVLEEKKAK